MTAPTPFPGHTAARNALTDAKTSADIRRIAADMVGDVEPLDLTMVARGADWTEPPPRRAYHCEPIRPDPMAVAVTFASVVLLVALGWVAGLLTVLFTIQ